MCSSGGEGFGLAKVFLRRNGRKKRKKGRVWPWGVLKKKTAGEFFPTKKWPTWRVLTEQERGEWPEGFSDAGRKLFSQQLVGRCTC